MNGCRGWGVVQRVEDGRSRSRTLRVVAVVAPILMVLLCAPIALGAPGDLDSTFGSSGKVTTDAGGGSVAGSALQPDGKLVVAGTAGNGTAGERDFLLARYTADGSLDATFGGDGTVVTDAGDEFDDAEALAIQGDGKIVVLGDNGEGIVAARYSPNGSLDPTFAGDGIRSLNAGDQVGATDVAIQSDGRIVLLGASDFFMTRLNSDGSTDTTFGNDGTVLTDFGGTFDDAAALAIQPDGKVVAVGGTGDDLAAFDFAVARYNSDGSLDTGFSGDGRQTTDFGGDFDYDDFAEDVVVRADRKIVAVGGKWQIARYNSDGSLDPSFGTAGKQETSFGGAQFARGAALDSDGKLVVVGGDGGDFALARYGADGSLDSTFGVAGTQTTEFSGGASAALSVVRQPDGKLVLAGNGSGRFALARYEGAADTAPPETRISYGPAGTTPDATPTFEFTSSETGSSFECRVDTSAFARCSSPHTTPTLANGSHTFEVRATDRAGNVDATPASRTFTVAVPPPPPLDSDGDGVPDASDACPSVAGSSANGCPPSSGGGSTGGAPPSGSGGGGGDTPASEPPADDGDGEEGGSPTIDEPSVGGPKSAGSAKVSSRGTLTVPKQSLDCTGDGPDCGARTAMTGSVPASKARASARRRKAKTVKLGGSRFTVEAGEKGKVTIKLTRKGLKLLKRLKRIKAKITITVKRGDEVFKKTVKVTLKAPKPKRGKARRKRR